MIKSKEALVSIVIPVYKVEKYIYGCLESVITQSYKNLEIILVDDGSPDRSPELIGQRRLYNICRFRRSNTSRNDKIFSGRIRKIGCRY